MTNNDTGTTKPPHTMSQSKGRWSEPRYVTVGHTFTNVGTRVDVVRPWKLFKAAWRHDAWTKKKQIAANNAELLKP